MSTPNVQRRRKRSEWKRSKAGYTEEQALDNIKNKVAWCQLNEHLEPRHTATHWVFGIPGEQNKSATPPRAEQVIGWYMRSNVMGHWTWHAVKNYENQEGDVIVNTPCTVGRSAEISIEIVPAPRGSARVCGRCKTYVERHGLK